MKKKRGSKETHKQSFAEELENPESYGVRTHPRKKVRGRQDAPEDADGALDVGQSEAILQLAKQQHEDAAAEAAHEAECEAGALQCARAAL